MAKKAVKPTTKTLGIVKNDPWLKDYEPAIAGRHQHAVDKIAELTGGGKTTLVGSFVDNLPSILCIF